MYLIGITGGIATGKSTVSRILQETYNISTIYVDRLARQVVEPGSAALAKLVEEFGKDILLPTGSLDRRKLRKITIHDAERMDCVTKIVWPEIASQMKKMMENLKAAGVKVVCVENAMLIESGNYNHYDEVIVVTCDKEVQLKRVMDRDSQTKEDAMAMINMQMSLEEKEKKATILVRNDHDLASLKEQVDFLYEDRLLSKLI